MKNTTITLDVNLESLFEMFSIVNNHMHKATQNMKIYTKYNYDKINNYNDFGKYLSYLFLISDEIIYIAKNKNIFIEYDVITDILFLDENSIKVPNTLEQCKYCPCIHCIPNIELFKRTSIDGHTPSINFCRKSFLEKETSIYLFEQLSEFSDMSNCKKPLEINYTNFINLLKKVNLDEK
jgi:hypothetical protein